MEFQTPLTPARLVRRYKRFLADMVLEDGAEITAHCPNPGAMTGLAEPGARCWLEPAAPGRKLSHGWRLVALPGGHMACVDTTLANRVVAEALAAGRVAGLETVSDLRAEVALAPGTRVDFAATDRDGRRVFIEVKSVTLLRNGWAEFPDSVTARGQKHLRELAAAAQGGARAVMLYAMARSDAPRFRIASDIDPGYAAAFDAARAAGVEMRAQGSIITPGGITPGDPVAVDKTAQAAVS
ncbi:MAG: DNA/RNA nuclease SfsA [Rhodobacteraceae bacterium]|nr:DNA/RNA nuclease SfsA [Paracoccaceae bacterium]